MSKEKRCFMLKNADSVRPGIGYVDDTGVYFSEVSISQAKRYENLDDLIMQTGASSFEWLPTIEPLPEELLNKKPYGLEGLTRSEGIIYLMLNQRESAMRDEIVAMLYSLVGTAPSSFHKLMSELRKKMPNNESIEYKNGVYKLIKD
ncbi:MAG: hypothetical protein OXI43_12625 [Candidatus Poribacteria bacterium]|nr:hypothetical protein [Candidatus Poribacteria bacterium]